MTFVSIKYTLHPTGLNPRKILIDPAIGDVSQDIGEAALTGTRKGLLKNTAVLSFCTTTMNPCKLFKRPDQAFVNATN